MTLMEKEREKREMHIISLLFLKKNITGCSTLILIKYSWFTNVFQVQGTC